LKFILLCISNKYIIFASMKSSELLRLLKKDGWFEIRQSGVPFHASKEVKKGLLNAILKEAEIKTPKR
jgi:mRNA interferase HicA